MTLSWHTMMEFESPLVRCVVNFLKNGGIGVLGG